MAVRVTPSRNLGVKSMVEAEDHAIAATAFDRAGVRNNSF
jgi:hypothetical protein